MRLHALQTLGAFVFIAALGAEGDGDVLRSLPMVGLAVLGACLVVLLQSLTIRTHLRAAVTEEAKGLVKTHWELCRGELNVRLAEINSDLAVLGDLERTVTRLEQCVSDLKDTLRHNGSGKTSR